ncbi:MAG: hypothetical protein OXT67_11820 [Zetaproteobacteria bacterium]|nr:hypothetical protein [Zetaproteobacteria bacterium]
MLWLSCFSISSSCRFASTLLAAVMWVAPLALATSPKPVAPTAPSFASDAIYPGDSIQQSLDKLKEALGALHEQLEQVGPAAVAQKNAGARALGACLIGRYLSHDCLPEAVLAFTAPVSAVLATQQLGHTLHGGAQQLLDSSRHKQQVVDALRSELRQAARLSEEIQLVLVSTHLNPAEFADLRDKFVAHLGAVYQLAVHHVVGLNAKLDASTIPAYLPYVYSQYQLFAGVQRLPYLQLPALALQWGVCLSHGASYVHKVGNLLSQDFWRVQHQKAVVRTRLAVESLLYPRATTDTLVPWAGLGMSWGMR